MAKKTIIFNVILVFLFCSASGQKKAPEKKSFFAIKTDLVFLSKNVLGNLNTAGLTLEKGFSDRHSIQITGTYAQGTRANFKSWQLIPEYKFFISKKENFEGFYTGVYLKYQDNVTLYPILSIDGSYKYIKANARTYAAGVTFGLQIYAAKHLTFDFLVGLGGRAFQQRMVVPPDANIFFMTPVKPQRVSNFDTRAVINVGYKF